MPDSWIRWGVDVIQLAQSHNNSVIDAFFVLVTLLGYEEFYLLLIPVVVWNVDKRVGVRLASLLLLSVYLNFVVKDALAWPRPPADQVRRIIDEPFSGMPSGHAQTSVVIFGYLASVGMLGWGVAALIAGSVGASRVFLGVHFPQDVIGGWLIGSLLLGVALWFLRQLDETRLSTTVMWAAALGVPVALTLAHPTPETVQSMGALFGLGAGYLLEEKWVGFEAHAARRQQIAKLAVGIAVLVVLWLGLKVILPAGAVFRFGRYGLLGLWGTLFAPALFVKLGWATQSTE